MGKFSKTLGRVLHRPAIFPVPGFVLKLLLGEISTILLTGQRPIPKRAMEAGFELRYPNLEPALHELLDGK
jgi:NAD dependent epimerase/dehydratase family enzyme